MAKGISVLVVDDEFLARLHLVDALQAASYEVLEASSADEAISLMESRSDIRCVFTDIQMPGSMDGIALAHYIRERWPPTVLVVTSALKRPEDLALPNGAQFISKPHLTHELDLLLQQAAQGLSS